ncbi:MAG: DUF2079 domain-containing protein [Patescibacteria group bacterium]
MKKFLEKYSIYLLILAFTLLYSAWSVNRHNHFGTDAVDLGIFDQPLWHLSRFEPPLSSIKYNQFPGANLFGDHFHPILILASALFWLWDDVRILLILQAVVVCLAALPLYKIAMKILQNQALSLAVIFSYLTFIGLQAALDYDFHETALAVLPLAVALYALVFSRFRLFWLSFVLGLLFKEDMPLYFFFIGALAALRFRKYRIGILTMILAAAYYLLVTQKIIPYFKGDRFAYEELPPELGKTTVDLIKTTVISPWKTFLAMFFPILKLKTILNYLASFSFLPLFDPLSLILTIPNGLARFLTQLPQRWIIRFQYGAVLAPLLSFGTIYGVRNILSLIERRARVQKYVSRVLVLALLAAPLIETGRTGTPLFKMLNPQYYSDSPAYQINRELLARIPKDASIMAQSAFVPHLTHRAEIYRYEDTLLPQTQPQYILMSLEEHSDPPYTLDQLTERVERLKTDPRYGIIYWDGIRLLMEKK